MALQQLPSGGNAVRETCAIGEKEIHLPVLRVAPEPNPLPKEGVLCCCCWLLLWPKPPNPPPKADILALYRVEMGELWSGKMSRMRNVVGGS
jgi:hypothetical protein